MGNINNSLPVLVLNCKLGGLAIMRSLGKLGVPVYGVDAEKNAPGLLSRYCREQFIYQFDENHSAADLDFVMGIGARFNTKAILIPTSDELAVFVANHAETLSRHFLFPANDPCLMENLISKEEMYHLALDHNVPTPATLFPKCLDEVEEYAAKVAFPVMLKGIHGNRLMARTGKKMVIVETREELLHNYRELEDSENPNLMIQEYIPGDDDTIFIFNGYFNRESECLAAFTGHKVRQYPVHTGCASLGKCTWVQDVADLTTQFMKAIGYRGILDIGYRFDARDGKYKVLDINPRIGQAFRLFLAQDGSDVARILYRDLLKMEIPAIVPREGRLWMIEDYDLESSLDYKREKTLTFGGWLKSFKGLEEGAWFDRKDLRPFLNMCGKLFCKALRYTGKNLGWDKTGKSGLQKV